jgi:hypothetical protein
MRASIPLTILLAAVLAAGCASVPESRTMRAQAPTAESQDRDRKKNADPDKDKDEKKNGDEKEGKDKDKADEPSKTLFEWAIGPKSKNGDSEQEEDVIVTDRPDFTESASTVGLGRVQLEAGYTFTRDRSGGSTTTTHTYPEALLRIGMFAEWFEFRVVESLTNSGTLAFGQTTDRADGSDDLELGCKLYLVKQKEFLPELGLIVSTTIPTGARTLTSNRVLPTVNFLYGWDVIPNLLDAGGEFLAAGAVDVDRHSYVEFAQSFTVGYKLTPQLSAFTEWYALYPYGATAPDVTAQYYFDTGFSYKITPDFQVDIRAGFGLNKHADDFFTGAGFAVRY